MTTINNANCFHPFISLNLSAKSLSPEAIGILWLLNTFPPNWQFDMPSLAKKFHISYRKLLKHLKSLVTHGFIKKSRHFDPNSNKFLSWQYSVAPDNRFLTSDCSNIDTRSHDTTYTSDCSNIDIQMPTTTSTTTTDCLNSDSRKESHEIKVLSDCSNIDTRSHNTTYTSDCSNIDTRSYAEPKKDYESVFQSQSLSLFGFLTVGHILPTVKKSTYGSENIYTSDCQKIDIHILSININIKDPLFLNVSPQILIFWEEERSLRFAPFQEEREKIASLEEEESSLKKNGYSQKSTFLPSHLHSGNETNISASPIPKPQNQADFGQESKDLDSSLVSTFLKKDLIKNSEINKNLDIEKSSARVVQPPTTKPNYKDLKNNPTARMDLRLKSKSHYQPNFEYPDWVSLFPQSELDSSAFASTFADFLDFWKSRRMQGTSFWEQKEIFKGDILASIKAFLFRNEESLLKQFIADYLGQKSPIPQTNGSDLNSIIEAFEQEKALKKKLEAERHAKNDAFLEKNRIAEQKLIAQKEAEKGHQEKSINLYSRICRLNDSKAFYESKLEALHKKHETLLPSKVDLMQLDMFPKRLQMVEQELQQYHSDYKAKYGKEWAISDNLKGGVLDNYKILKRFKNNPTSAPSPEIIAERKQLILDYIESVDSSVNSNI